jgi:tetratricopeptide (TPR) repeat protein
MFKKKEVYKVKSITVDPATLRNVTTGDEYFKRGVAYYARKQYESSEKDLRTAIALDADQIDAYYYLGMVLKAALKNQDAIQSFEKVLDLLSQTRMKNYDRQSMLRRLTQAHINFMKTGDWDLEKEMWHHIQ